MRDPTNSGVASPPIAKTYTFEGKKVNSYEDLINIESEKRQQEIKLLLQSIKEQEDQIEENEGYFNDNYLNLDSELDILYDDVLTEEDNLEDLETMVNQSNQLLAQQKNMKAPTAETTLSSEEKLSKLVSEFLIALGMVTFVGILIGSLCVCCLMHANKQKQAQRLAEAQSNPAFRFAETTDPSASSGGIPAMNPIAMEEIKKESA